MVIPMSRKATMDGNTAAAMASYYFTEVAAIYPITPSSPMAEAVDKWASEGKENIFGKPVRLIEMQLRAERRVPFTEVCRQVHCPPPTHLRRGFC